MAWRCTLLAECETLKKKGLAGLVASMDKPLLFNCLRMDDVNLLTAISEQRIDIHPETGKKTSYEVTTYPDWGYYNTAKMISPETLCGPEYTEKFLLPFGEYLPFEKQLSFMCPPKDRFVFISGTVCFISLPVYYSLISFGKS